MNYRLKFNKTNRHSERSERISSSVTGTIRRLSKPLAAFFIINPPLKGGVLGMRSRRGMFSLTSIRKWSKPIAAFFILNMLTSIVAPYAAMALTSGPTAPEYTSFEPVDTTDMVNLATGDFVYNLPLLEVPGPAGGYPLSLSYHAGIMPDEEASWVGLGWTLNPGAINRTVNGYPDDQYGAERKRHDYVHGGTRNTFSVGLGVGPVTYGLSISHDTYQGFGMGSSFSVGYNLFNSDNNGVGIGLNATIGDDGYGNSFSGIGAGLTIGKGGAEAKGLATNVGISTNFNSTSFSGGISYRQNSVAQNGKVGTASSQSLVGGSISSKGLKPSASIGGITSSQHNSKAGNWTTKGSGFSIPIPLGPVLLNLGYRYMRYYIDETTELQVVGSFHGNKTSGKNYDDWSYDSYALVEVEKDYTKQDPEKDRGGSFPAYDQYNVNAQGLSGSIRPFHSRVGHLMRQNLKTADQSAYEIKYLSEGSTLPKPYFRFINDFSNAFTYDENAKLNGSSFDMVDGYANVDFRGYSNGKVAGSKNIETYTNQSIESGTAFNDGFIDYKPFSSREIEIYGGDIKDQIGGYKITNESGVTYHYALPVYTYDEYSRNEKTDEPNQIYTEYDQRNPYAYTWLLTAITGPDFVDRGGGSASKNPNGLLDENDWGYWVKFDYGKWTDQYFWRNPGEGKHVDLDTERSSFAEGTKELYYLDAIQTKTHTALFVKDVRNDAKGALKHFRNRSNVLNTGWQLENPTDDHREGGFGTKTLTTQATGKYLDGVSLKTYTETLEYESEPTQTLRLDRIILLKNDDVPNVSNLKNDGNWTSETKEYKWPRAFENLPDPWFTDQKNKIRAMWNQLEDISFNQHLYNNVLDIRDITFSDYRDEALRIIDLDNNSYHLANGAPNSSSGKLTLQAVEMLGKGGVKVTPETTFHYDKNPAWKKDHHDIWGFYKSDYQDLQDENLSRLVSENSAENVDAWSLSKIKTSLGSSIEVNYESDSYNTPVLYKNHILRVSQYDNGKLYFDSSTPDLNLLFKAGEKLDLKTFFSWTPFLSSSTCNGFSYQQGSGSAEYVVNDNLYTISDVFDNGSVKYIDISVRPSIKPADKTVNNGCYTCSNSYYIPNSGVYGSLVTQTGTSCLYSYYEEGINKQISVLANYSVGSFVYRYQNPEFIAGNVSVRNDGGQKGGGLRVSKISVTNGNTVGSTKYSYQDIESENLNSGYTSYEPFGLSLASFLISGVPDENKSKYQKSLNKELSDLLLVSREVQAPGVVYEYVTVTEEVDGKPVPGKQVYNFQVFEEDFVEREPIASSSQNETESCDCDLVYAACEGKDNFEEGPCWDQSCLQLKTKCNNQGGGTITRDVTNEYISPMTIKDFTTRVGNLKSVKTYGKNDQLLMETETIYQYDLEKAKVSRSPEHDKYWEDINGHFKNSIRDKFNNQGVTHEMFTELRLVREEDGTNSSRKVLSRKEYYPAVVVGTRTKNHKTGITAETRNLAFDFFTGDATVTWSDDGYGNQYVSKAIPAYHFYDDMGLMLKGGKNMLTQEGASYSYIMQDQFDPDAFTYEDVETVASASKGLMGASMQTWSKGISVINGDTRYDNPVAEVADDVYRKHQSFSFRGLATIQQRADGSYPVASFDELTESGFASRLEQGDWQKNSEITLYDVNSHALEAMDVNGNYAATRFDRSNERVLATVANSRYGEFTASGFENSKDGGITATGNGSGRTSEKSHTGDWSLKLVGTAPVGRAIFSMDNAEKNRTYTISYWTQQPSAPARLFYKINGGSDMTIPVSSSIARSVEIDGDTWKLCTAAITTPSSFSTFDIGLKYDGGTVYIDDFRVYPMDATMTSYVYNDYGELSDILDANNLFTHYDYDAMGRLKSVTRETLADGPVMTSMADIHYGKGIEPNVNGTISITYPSPTNARFTFEFASKTSGGYSYEWKVNGQPISGFSSANYAFSQGQDYHVTVKVTNTSTGQVFSKYQQERLQYCEPAGTILSTLCEVDTDGCYTGWADVTRATGSCTGVTTHEYDPTLCNGSQSGPGQQNPQLVEDRDCTIISN